MTYTFLFQEFYSFFLIFARIGSAFMLMPGFGEFLMPVRLRLMFAMLTAMGLVPMLSAIVPPFSHNSLGIQEVLFVEIFVGLFLGLVGRILLSIFDVVGSIFSLQMGLSNATLFNPMISAHGTVIGTFLSLSAVLIIFSLDLHHQTLQALLSSYQLIPIGAPLDLSDMFVSIRSVVVHSFQTGIQLSIPILIAGTFFQIVLGVTNRLVPQIQVFFVGLPLQIILGILILMATINGMILYFGHSYTGWYESFLGMR